MLHVLNIPSSQQHAQMQKPVMHVCPTTTTTIIMKPYPLNQGRPGATTFLKIEPIICFSKLLIANCQSDTTLYLCLGVGTDIFEGKKMKRNIQKENRSDLHNAHPNVSFKVGVVLKQVMNKFGTMKKSPLRWDHC